MKHKLCFHLIVILGMGFHATAAERPQVGGKAPGFSLKTLDDRSVSLDELNKGAKVVLIVLRGWPGYQCPLCERQVQDFIARAGDFAAADAKVVMVYPGPVDHLKARAREFLEMKGKQWPGEFVYLIDPGYSMINAYGLRWEAPGETAYPSTFVLDRAGVIRFAKISGNHAGRTQAADVLNQLRTLADP